MIPATDEEMEAWRRRRAEVIDAGERPMVAAICPSCHHRIPVQDRGGWSDVKDCDCGNEISGGEIYKAAFGFYHDGAYWTTESHKLRKAD